MLNVSTNERFLIHEFQDIAFKTTNVLTHSRSIFSVL